MNTFKRVVALAAKDVANLAKYVAGVLAVAVVIVGAAFSVFGIIIVVAWALGAEPQGRPDYLLMGWGAGTIAMAAVGYVAYLVQRARDE